jgi:hypothetical protein
MALQRNMPDILQCYLLATHHDPEWYKAWHTWARANFDVVGYMDSARDSKTGDIIGDALAAHAVQAIQGGCMCNLDVAAVLTEHRLFPFYPTQQRGHTAGFTAVAHPLVQVRSP